MVHQNSFGKADVLLVKVWARYLESEQSLTSANLLKKCETPNVYTHRLASVMTKTDSSPLLDAPI
jgi:hypothetical protein